MSEYISKEEFEKRIKPYDTEDHTDKALYNFAHNHIICCPSADVRPNLHGHWIEKGYVGDGNYLFECSECHSTDTQSKTVKVNYCWHCGADMREPKPIGVFKRLNDSTTGEPIQDIREPKGEKGTE